MLRTLAILLACCSVGSAQELVSTSSGQLRTTTQTVTSRTWIEAGKDLSTEIVGGDESAPVVTTVKLVRVNTDSEAITVRVEDANHVEVTGSFKEVSKNIFASTKPGTFWFYATDWDNRREDRLKVVVDDGVQPDPIDPKPPKPEPPTPKPAVKNLVVLVVYESGEMLAMPPPQREILQSTALRTWLNEKCWKEPGATAGMVQPAYRFFDKDVVFPAACDTTWCKLMKQPRTSVPWLIIADQNVPVLQVPLPATVDEMKKLIEGAINGK